MDDFLINPVFSKTFSDTLESCNKALHSAQQFIEICHTTTYNQGKMKFHSHFHVLNLLCYIYRYISIKMKPELQKNILKYGYGINYKYEGMVACSFDRCYVVIKFILPTMDELKLSPTNYNGECRYLENLDDNDNEEIKTGIKDLLTYCIEVRPYMAFYKMQIKAHNKTAHHILKNEVDLILPKFSEGRESKRGNFSTIISGFVGLVF